MRCLKQTGPPKTRSAPTRRRRMAESKKKAQPAWLTGEPEPARATPRISPVGRGRGSLAEDGTGEMPTVTPPAAETAQEEQDVTRTIPRVSGAPGGTGERFPQPPLIRGGTEDTFSQLAGRLRENPKPALIAFLALAAMVFLFWLVFLRSGGEDPETIATPPDGAPAGRQAAE